MARDKKLQEDVDKLKKIVELQKKKLAEKDERIEELEDIALEGGEAGADELDKLIAELEGDE